MIVNYFCIEDRYDNYLYQHHTMNKCKVIAFIATLVFTPAWMEKSFLEPPKNNCFLALNHTKSCSTLVSSHPPACKIWNSSLCGLLLLLQVFVFMWFSRSSNGAVRGSNKEARSHINNSAQVTLSTKFLVLCYNFSFR